MKQEIVCQITLIDEKKVKAAKAKMLDDMVYADLTEFFTAMSNITRVKILHILSKGELCVCDISAVMDMSISSISHQLRVLRNLKLVRARKEGKIVRYSLNDDHVVQLLKMAYEHVTE